MFLTDRMLEQHHKNYLEEQRQTDLQQDPEEDEMGMAYLPRPSFVPLNEEKGVFEARNIGGINTNPSVFDRTTLFHVTREER